MELIRQILAFSRKSESEHGHLKIQPILKETVKLLRGSLPSTIEIREMIDIQWKDNSKARIIDIEQDNELLFDLTHSGDEFGFQLESHARRRLDLIVT